MLILFVRTIILYAIVVIVVRVMGKRQIGQLQPFELVVAILLADLTAIPMQDKDLPLLSGLIPVMALLLAQVTLSFWTLKSERARAVICGTPSVLIENGKILEHELARLRININDLLEQLRSKNVPNIADVEFAILETSGHLSVIPKSQKRPVNPTDLQIATEYEGLPLPLILDGNVNQKNLRRFNLDQGWLNEELAKYAIKNPREVLLASLDTAGKLFYQVKESYSITKVR